MRFNLTLGFTAAMQKAARLIAQFNDAAVMGESIEQRRGHLGIAKHVRPFGKGQVGHDNHTGVLIARGQ